MCDEYAPLLGMKMESFLKKFWKNTRGCARTHTHTHTHTVNVFTACLPNPVAHKCFPPPCNI